MTEQKFHIPALILSAVGCVLTFFMLPVEAIAAGGAGLVLSTMKRNSHRVKLSAALGIIALIGGLCMLGWMIYAGTRGIAGFEYWFYHIFHR